MLQHLMDTLLDTIYTFHLSMGQDMNAHPCSLHCDKGPDGTQNIQVSLS